MINAGARDNIARLVLASDLHSSHPQVDQLAFRTEAGTSVEPKCPQENLGGMIGHSPALRHVLEKAALVAGTDATVLIQGETGTGKEILAHGIHQSSRRSAKPFVTVNCGAIPRELAESEIFGHVKGSFTGAVSDRKGKAEAAHGGTLFLDEIGELPLELQPKLLRLLQSGEIEKVGAFTTTRVDIRVIAATHRNLTEMIETGGFREDLYYRLNVVPLELPSLRDRAEDIPELVDYFLKRKCSKHGRGHLRLPDHVLRRFIAYRWPGNIRELKNIIERIVVLTQGNEIGLSDLPPLLRSDSGPVHIESRSKGCSLISMEKEMLLHALQACDWNQSQAARHLGLTRKTLVYRMHKYRLDEDRPLPFTPGVAFG